jgi:putative phosphoesterase
MARVILVADTHIPKVGPAMPSRLLQECEGADLILHAGDLIEMSVMEKLSSLAPTRAVVGKSLLPDKTVVEVEGKLVGLIHGWGPPMGIERRVLSRFSGVDVVVFGHTHKALVDERKGTMLVNPGTPNDRRFSDRLSYAVLTIANGIIEAEIIWMD